MKGPLLPDEVLEVARQVAGIVRRVTGDAACRVVLFGSWVAGRAAERSDIDVGIFGSSEIDPEAMAEIRDACDALPTLHSVDLVDLATVPPELRRAALEEGIELEAAWMAAERASRRELFGQVLARLEEVLARPEDPVVRDAAIQRFEFTFELAWRAIQDHARAEGLDCVSPRDCFRKAFRLGLLDRDAAWLAMVEDRNRTSHVYDEGTARKVYGALPLYARLLRGLLARLEDAARRAATEEQGDEGGG